MLQVHQPMVVAVAGIKMLVVVVVQISEAALILEKVCRHPLMQLVIGILSWLVLQLLQVLAVVEVDILNLIQIKMHLQFLQIIQLGVREQPMAEKKVVV
jgi:hypothetical protein